MNHCFCRHRALAFGGGNASKNGSDIKDASTGKDSNTIKTIVENTSYHDPDRITMKQMKDINKKVERIVVPDEDEVDSSEMVEDSFNQYGILVYT